jgi:hypothetical protein
MILFAIAEDFGSLNIVEILKLGLPGVVFLLSLFAYRLLHQEQKQKEPREKILRSIKQFMFLNVLFAVLTLIAPVIDAVWGKEGANGSGHAESMKISGKISSSPVLPGEAVVCQGVEYTGRFLLLKDEKTGHLIQVFAAKVMPCTDGNQYINLSPRDTKNLGWEASLGESMLEVSVAMAGYKFNL